jgi:hypothetical protein
MHHGQKVRVHFNLHLHDWSIVALEGPEKGRVIGRADQLTLKDCTFRVSETSRQKVIERKCRSVHAWVFGYLTATTSVPPEAIEFTYNPYRAPTFTLRDTWQPITKSSVVWFANKKAYATI